MRTRPNPGEMGPADRRAFELWASSPGLSLAGTAITIERGGAPLADAYVTATWGGEQARFAAEFRAQSNPGSVDVAILQARRAAEETGLAPMVIVPYLSEERLLELERRGVSGLDMSGNGLILADGFRVWQSGKPNLYRESAAIRNPMRGDSSVFARSFLLRPEFASLTELRDFALSRTLLPAAGASSPLRLGTASKVVRRLRDDRLVGKSGLRLRLEDPRGMMDALREGYAPEAGRRRIVGRTALATEALWERLAGARARRGLRYAATGLASAAYHGALFGMERLDLYVDDLDEVAELLEVQVGRAFANVTLMETDRNVPFFDLRADGDALWASPIQTWLELAHGGPREQEAAESLAQRLVDGARA